MTTQGKTRGQPRVNVFNREWWRPGPNGTRVPGAGPKTYMAYDVSWAIGREIAREYNATHEPGFLSRKAELEEV